LAFRYHGKALVFTVNVIPSGPVHVLKVIDVILASLAPGKPLPDFRVAFPFELLQVSTVPVLVSVSVVLTVDVAVAAPPGLTVHVVAVAATEEAAPRPMVRAIAPAVKRTLAVGVRMVINSLVTGDVDVRASHQSGGRKAGLPR
jgi:hypothetical protein